MLQSLILSDYLFAFVPIASNLHDLIARENSST